MEKIKENDSSKIRERLEKTKKRLERAYKSLEMSYYLGMMGSVSLLGYGIIMGGGIPAYAASVGVAGLAYAAQHAIAKYSNKYRDFMEKTGLDLEDKEYSKRFKNFLHDSFYNYSIDKNIVKKAQTFAKPLGQEKTIRRLTNIVMDRFPTITPGSAGMTGLQAFWTPLAAAGAFSGVFPNVEQTFMIAAAGVIGAAVYLHKKHGRSSEVFKAYHELEKFVKTNENKAYELLIENNQVKGK